MFGNLKTLIINGLIIFCTISLWPDGLSILVEMEITRVGNKILNNSIIFSSIYYNYTMRPSVYCNGCAKIIIKKKKEEEEGLCELKRKLEDRYRIDKLIKLS